MNELKVLETREVFGKQLNIYGTLEEPLFLAKDVAEWIDYSKTSQGYYNVSKMLMTVDDDEKYTITNSNSGGKLLFLTENGLYEVLMQSRKPIAKQFKKEVKKILKEIRQYGYYAQGETIQDQMTTIVNGVKEKINDLDSISKYELVQSRSMNNLLTDVIDYVANASRNIREQRGYENFPVFKRYSIDELLNELYWDYHKYVSVDSVIKIMINLGYVKYNEQYKFMEIINFKHVKSCTPYISFSEEFYYSLIQYFANRNPKKQILIYD